MITLIDKPLKSNIFCVSDLLMLPSTAPLINYRLVIKFSSHWMDKTYKTVAISPLHLSPNMSDMISRCPSHISRIYLLYALSITKQLIRNDHSVNKT